MKRRYDLLLKEIYKIDPKMKKYENEILRIFEELSMSKPEIKIDEDFKKMLKMKLSEKIVRREKRSIVDSFENLIKIRRKIFLTVSSGFAIILIAVICFNLIKPVFYKNTVNTKMVQNDIMLFSNKSSEESLTSKKKADYDENGGTSSEKEEPKSEDKQAMARDYNTEEYDRIAENNFKNPVNDPLSTFSIDVDTASYANVRRFLQNGQMPYKDAVRIEEMINYFSYDYKQPDDGKPFAVNMEISDCPWNGKNKLLLIGIQGKKIDLENLPPNNLVFLIDVSGSMEDENKLPLIKQSLRLLVDRMRVQDRISIVVYAGSSGVVLPPTSGHEKGRILGAIENLESGGSTAGGEGIALAYKIANGNFIKNGNNRIILSTDGDFNVGVSSDGELVRMIEDERKTGVFLTVLGFGMGNFKDSKMEKLADAGNGNYGYIDTLNEAKKVLVSQMGGTLFTIAKDVKLQIEFNPAIVSGYRLVGYENRLLNKEDFDDDRKDAGEIGAGLTVTALYELAISNGEHSRNDLKYQKTEIKNEAAKSNEALYVKIRYKKPDSGTSVLLDFPLTYDPVSFAESSNNFKWASSVAEFGMLLRDSEFKADSNFSKVLEMAKGSVGEDSEGYRKEFIELVKKAKDLSGK
jgi:Ca-activated chloride channel homolog